MSVGPAIQTEELTRIYKIRGGKKSDPKELVALKDVDIQVARGELFGLLGPNGAGKTTLIKVLTTLLAPTKGHAFVAGYDVVKDPHEIRSRINMVSGGEASGYGLLTVRENLWMFSQFYGIPSREANRRIKELLYQEDYTLDDARKKLGDEVAGGKRPKLVHADAAPAVEPGSAASDPPARPASAVHAKRRRIDEEPPPPSDDDEIPF